MVKSLGRRKWDRRPGHGLRAQDARCRACDYGPSTFNIPHRFVASILYELPFGKGHQFLNHGGIANLVVGGWQMSSIVTAQSGPPLDTTSWDSAGTSFVPASTRLNCVAGVNP